MLKISQIHSFSELINKINQTHETLKNNALKAVNVSLTVRNWLFGFYIVEYEQNGTDRAKYGKHLLENLSKSLAAKGLKNIAVAELSRFRQFYNVYPQIFGTLSQESLHLPKQILETVSQELQIADNQIYVEPAKLLANLSFSHFSELIKIDDSLKRAFYEIECIKGTWGVRELRRQINSLFYERTGISKNPEKLINIVQNTVQKQNFDDIAKTHFAFEFLGFKTKDIVLELDLEQAIMDNLQNFLLELGNGFCFEARQKKILIGDEYFFIDLIFYHRILHCHVLVEIKVDEFQHGYMGQLNAYLEHYKRNEMHDGDNPPVGILLVTNKNDTLVEYAKGTMDNQLFVSKYLLELPNKDELIKIIKKEISHL
ncbi:MAG: PDDEXK nuclease domain-containing protein [Fibromonadales bacterium]|nr:PDDEXK nuclease domain-containing protein [Fibromonadales bacterium]